MIDCDMSVPSKTKNLNRNFVWLILDTSVLFLNIKGILWGITHMFLFTQKYLSTYLLSGAVLYTTAVNQRISALM